MPKRAGITTKEHLTSAPLPEKTDTYTVISHGFIINKTKEILDRMGFDVVRELYRCNESADIAQGVYHLKFEGEQDPEMGMMFAWANSYDKSMRFKCAVGGYLNNSQSVIISGQMGSWARKHSGTADSEASDMIISQIESARDYYAQLVEDKKAMKAITVSDKQRAELVGRIYLQHELLTGEQLIIAKEQFKKPSFDYNAPKDSLWCMYNGLIYALQKAHPRTWMDQQRMIHWMLTEEFGIKPGFVAAVAAVGTAEENPGTEEELVVTNQITIEQVIKEETSELTITPTAGGNEHVEEVTKTEEVVEEPKEEEPPVIQEPAVISPTTTSEDLEPESEVLVQTTLDPDTWPCVKCGEEQAVDAIFHDGQLCDRCFKEAL